MEPITIDKPADGTPVGVSSLSTTTANTDVSSLTEVPTSSGMDPSTLVTKTNTTAPATAPLPASAPIFTPVTTDAPTSVPIDPSTIEEGNAIQNQKYVEEFQYLLEKSQSLFSGLRDLPPTGSHRQWRPYFEKTFEVYTKLWKFQQAHRSLLEEKNNYGLKRWEVGEIASKIGQLYYHYYLRTSETNYLNEAYVFYEAIHDRQYFKNILEVKNPALMIKKMRYYARFIVVCLLLNKDDNIRLLISELELLIDEYTKTFKPVDAKEWQMVLQEIMTFMEAEKKLVPINADRTQVPIQHRLPAQQVDKPQGLRLQEAILVGNYQNQIKFSELTLDMYRMLQSLEREPAGKPSTRELQPAAAAAVEKKDQSKESTLNTQSPTTSQPSHVGSKRTNPHKYLLYRPTLSQLMVYIATAFKDTGDSAVMLLYLSADGYVNEASRVFGFSGGVSTSQRTPSLNIANSNSNIANNNSTAGGNNTSNTNNTSTSSSNNNNNNNNSNNPSNNINATNSTSNNNTANTSTANNNNNNTANTNTSNINNPSNNISSSNTVNSTNAGNVTNGVNTPLTNDSPDNAIEETPPALSVPTQSTMPACLYPADLTPFTRKPLFLIVDSNNSTAYQQMTPTLFDQPLMCLLSPTMYPSSIQDKSEIGSLFTLFLHTPLLAFCSVSDIGNLDQDKWDECIHKVTQLERAIGKSLLDHPDLDNSVKRFMTDDFLWTFIVRFVLCGIILRCHSSFKNEKSYPTSLPSVPEVIYTAPDIMVLFNELTLIADVSTYFNIPLPTIPPSTNTVIPPSNPPSTTISPMDLA